MSAPTPGIDLAESLAWVVLGVASLALLAGAYPFTCPISAVAAIAWLLLVRVHARRPRAHVAIEMLRAALLSTPPSLLVAALFFLDRYLSRFEPSLRAPPPHPLEAMITGVSFPHAVVLTTLLCGWLIAFAWRMNRPRPDDSQT